MLDENKKIVICKDCHKPEYWGEMRWLSGRCTCRNCYKAQWETENHAVYTWDDLDGPRPTMEDYENQINSPCIDCDSTSMEMCLQIRHCPHWVKRR